MSWWGDAWDTAGDTVSGWFDDGGADTSGYSEPSAGDLGVGNPGSYGGSNDMGSMYGLDDSYDVSPEGWSQDYDSDDLWGSVGSGLAKAGSATVDFLGTKAGTQMATTALGMLGQYLMEDDASGKARSAVRTASSMGGGGSGGGGGGTVEATTSKLGQW